MTDPERYTILLERDSDGAWGAWSPDLPGCVALGDSFDECVAQMREAITGHLAVMRDYGDPIPPPTGPGVYISAEAVEPATA